MEDRGFNSFISNMINLSVNETKRSSLLAKTRAFILYISNFDLNVCFRARKVTGTFEKRAPGQNKMETNRQTPQEKRSEKAKTSFSHS